MDNATIAQRIKESAAEIHNAVCNGTVDIEQVKAAKDKLDALAGELSVSAYKPPPVSPPAPDEE